MRTAERMSIAHVVLDRCSRCSVFTAFEIKSFTTVSDLLGLWAMTKALENARFERYLDYAIACARSGRLETARDVTLEIVGHVTAEDPRPHMVLGCIAAVLQQRQHRMSCL